MLNCGTTDTFLGHRTLGNSEEGAPYPAMGIKEVFLEDKMKS